MGYRHLNIDEREDILKMQAQQASMQQIGYRLGLSKGTISRKLSRNVRSTRDYKPNFAQRYYQKSRKEFKAPYRLEEDACLREYVQEKLRQYWSPEQMIDIGHPIWYQQADRVKAHTGIEDFQWEEIYVISPGDKEEYDNLKKTQSSYID
jgi:IS30 family transposase